MNFLYSAFLGLYAILERPELSCKPVVRVSICHACQVHPTSILSKADRLASFTLLAYQDTEAVRSIYRSLVKLCDRVIECRTYYCSLERSTTRARTYSIEAQQSQLVETGLRLVSILRFAGIPAQRQPDVALKLYISHYLFLPETLCVLRCSSPCRRRYLMSCISLRGRKLHVFLRHS